MEMEVTRFAKGLDPVADAFSGTVRSDVVDISNYGKARFIIYKGVGTTGTSTVTVSACSDNTPSAETAVPFYYRRNNDSDTPGDLTAATTAGFTTTAGSSDVYIVEVDNKALASTGYKRVCLKMVESVDSPVLGGILIELLEPRHARSSAAITG